ncbi:glycosyltransferase family 4 protein [Bradyrhizobium sp. SHOUNA76]|uniref:glycosyltransferase family 4 protein n=1 Tax=Bradyrhizobium sp. SHOUNA76 TaxID=2908927 RepID=UPI001FF0F6E0|nr:glycosyltransferase family 4 protein [Bradyrhizobium sp. SHOUNA76]MCJ9701410.1 glycosyltransferase family 4 protein [Bradyrhizobium sp. SHOUNA76]
MNRLARVDGTEKTFFFVVSGDETYGVRRLTLSLIAALVKLGVNCRVISMAPGPMADDCLEAGADCEILSLGIPPNFGTGFWQSIGRIVSLALYLRRAVKAVSQRMGQLKPDAAIVRMPNLVPIASMAAHSAGVTTYWIIPNAISDGYPFRLNKWIYDFWFYWYSVKPLANSAFTRKTLLNRKVQSAVFYLGIDSEEFSSESHSRTQRASLGLNEADIVFGIFARLVPEKGQELIIRSLADGGDEFESIKLLLCGGPYEAEYQHHLVGLVRSLGLDGRVVFLGPVKEVVPVCMTCDVVVNSRIDAEPFGLSVIEAMMLEKPVLAHSLGGPSETVVDGVTGWLFHEPTVNCVRDALRRTLKDRDKWARMGQAGRARAIEHFDIARVAADLCGIVERTPSPSKNISRAG